VRYKKQKLLTPSFVFDSVLFIVLVFCVVLLCVFTFLVPHSDVRYNFRIIMMFGSSLLPLVCRIVHVLFMLFVFAAYTGVQHILIFMCNMAGVL
jgi:hypothetical protein